MGYRSDVAYIIKFENKEDFWGFIAETKLSPETEECYTDEGFEVKEDEFILQFKAMHVKWYEDYKDVKCHVALWDRMEERDEDVVGAGFVRIGEEVEDIEERWFGNDPPYDELGVNRSIYTTW